MLKKLAEHLAIHFPKAAIKCQAGKRLNMKETREATVYAFGFMDGDAATTGKRNARAAINLGCGRVDRLFTAPEEESENATSAGS